MASSNPFDLLDSGSGNDGNEGSPVVTVKETVAYVSKEVSKESTAAASAQTTHRRLVPAKPTHSSSSDHAPSRLVYSREWLLQHHKNYPAPAGFDSSKTAFHLLSQLPVALLPMSHDVRAGLGVPCENWCCDLGVEQQERPASFDWKLRKGL